MQPIISKTVTGGMCPVHETPNSVGGCIMCQFEARPPVEPTEAIKEALSAIEPILYDLSMWPESSCPPSFRVGLHIVLSKADGSPSVYDVDHGLNRGKNPMMTLGDLRRLRDAYSTLKKSINA